MGNNRQVDNTTRSSSGSLMSTTSVVGRQEQLEALTTALERTIRQENGNHQVLVVRAPAGVGKTALIDAFVRQQDEDECCWVCRAQVQERASASAPFAALIRVFDGLVHHMIQKKKEWFWRQRIGAAIQASELELVAEIIPSLKRFCPPETVDAVAATNKKRPILAVSAVSSVYVLQEETTQTSSFGKLNAQEFRFSRFRFALRGLIRCISTLQPLLLILDDFHWIDLDSLKILETILIDDRSYPGRKLLFVGTMRPLSSSSSSCRTNLTTEAIGSLRSSVRLQKALTAFLAHDNTQILELPGLSTAEVATLLSDLLSHDEDDVQELALLLKQHTDGNAFLVAQLVRYLEAENLIRNLNEDSSDAAPAPTTKEWNCNRIASFLSSSGASCSGMTKNNAVNQVVTRRLQALDPELRSALTVASCFRASHFDVSTIVHAEAVVLEVQAVLMAAAEGESVVCNGNEEQEDGALLVDEAAEPDPYVVNCRIRSMKELMKTAIIGGFVVLEAAEEGGGYAFAHDRIREAAYSLLPKDYCSRKLHLQIGRRLRSWMDLQEELGLSQSFFSAESLLLHCTNQLSAALPLITDVWEKKDLADLHYQAAQLAAKKTSFFSALEHLESGIEIIVGDLEGNCDVGWNDNYNMAIKLTIALARMQYSCGLLEESLRSSDVLIRRARTFADRRPAYYTNVFCLYQLGRTEAAMDQVLSALDELGRPFPRRFVLLHAVREFLKMGRILKKRTDESILRLPRATSTTTIDCAGFIEWVAEISYHSDHTGYSLLYPLRLLQLVMVDKGHCSLSGLALCIWGVLRNMMRGDLSSGYRFGKLGIKLLDPYKDSHPGHFARTVSIYYWSLAHWKAPLRDGLEPVNDAFAALERCGSLDYIHMDKGIQLRIMLICGEPLDAIERESRLYAESLCDYKQKPPFELNRPFLQTILNLQGPNESRNNVASQLTGEVMTEEEYVAECVRANNSGGLYQYGFFKLMLCYLFNDLESAEKAIQQMPRGDGFEGPFLPLGIFYTGLVYLALARRTKRKVHYRRKAQPAVRQIRRWVSQGSPNCVFMNSLLKAESMACLPRAKLGSAMQAYDEAIEAASSAGLCHHQALAHELAGAFLFERNEAGLAREYIFSSIKLYNSWGASAKAREVQSRFWSTIKAAFTAPEACPTVRSSSSTMSCSFVRKSVAEATTVSANCSSA